MRRNVGIDFIRGISILLVVILHTDLGQRIPLKKSYLADVAPEWFIRTLTRNGLAAVTIFFVISGFLITAQTLSRWKSLRAIGVRDFYSRRALRILPLFLTLLGILSLLHFAGVEHYVIDGKDHSYRGALFSALGMYLNWYEAQTGYLPASWDVLWSLSIEEAFYLGFPIVCVALRREWIGFLCAFVFALSLPILKNSTGGSPIWEDKAYLPGMASISMGVAVAIATRWVSPSRRLTLTLRTVAAVCLIARLCFPGFLYKHLGSGAELVLTGSTALLLASFVWHPLERTYFGMSWICSAGRLSYEMYLTHIFIVWLVVDTFRATGTVYEWGFLWHLAVLLLSWGLASVVAGAFTLRLQTQAIQGRRSEQRGVY